MAFFIPVVFACLVGGQCGFVYGVAAYTEKECQNQLNIMRNDIGQRPGVEAHQGTCIPLKAV
jgi:hypothetical protein